MLASIQALRGFAALMVVYFHAHAYIVRWHDELGLTGAFWGAEQNVTKLGALGVDIFFVISGFIIFYSVWDKKITTLDFLSLRVRRIYPLYWLATLCLVALSLRPGNSEPLDLTWLFASFALFPTFHEGEVRPILLVGWSLYYEMFFYVVFSLLIWQSRLKILLQITVLFVSLILLGKMYQIDLAVWQVVTDDRLLEFVAGGWFAYLYKTRDIRWTAALRVLCWTVVLLGVTAFVFVDGWRDDYRAVVTRGPIAVAIFALFLYDASLIRHVSGRFLSFLGDASYSIYLFHLLSFIPFSILWSRGLLIPPFGGVVTWALLFAIGTTAGIVGHLAFEKPLLAFFRTRRPGTKAFARGRAT